MQGEGSNLQNLKKKKIINNGNNLQQLFAEKMRKALQQRRLDKAASVQGEGSNLQNLKKKKIINNAI